MPANTLPAPSPRNRPVALRVIADDFDGTAAAAGPFPIRPSPPLPAIPPGDPFSPHKVLLHFDRLRAIARGEHAWPVTVEIDPTNVCNHRCGWCVSAQSHTGEQLTPERLESLVAELAAADVRSVVVKGGGEPSTHPHFARLVDGLRASGLAVGLITNGSFPRAGGIAAARRTCSWVRVSLDAATAETHRLIHGTRDFDKVVANVAALAEGDDAPVVGLNFVAEPRNHTEMAAFARLGRQLGVAYVSIRCVFDPDKPMSAETRAALRAESDAAKHEATAGFRVFLGNFTDRYLNADATAPFPHARCLGPNLVGVVGGDGEVYACCFLRGDKRFSFGNVNRQSFADVWTGPKRQQVMDAVYRGDCGRACAGGMTANRYSTYNDILNYLAAEEKRHAEFA